MAKFLRNRWLHWPLLIGVLAALGVGIYAAEQPEPMCVIDAGRLAPLCFADEGRRLVTYVEGPVELGPNGWGEPPILAPIQVWDTRTGAERLRELKNGQKLGHPAFSADGRYIAVEPVETRTGDELPQTAKNPILLVDTVTEVVRELPLQDSAPMGGLYFSPKGDLLARLQFDDEKGLRLWDPASGFMLDERATKPGHGVTFSADALLHRLPGGKRADNVEIWNLRERKKVALLENVGAIFALSPDGRFFVAERSTPEGDRSNNWGVWNVATGHLEAEFQTERPGEEAEQGSDPIISGDGRWVVMTCEGQQGKYLEIRALPDGKKIATLPVNRLFPSFFSPDGKFLAVNGLDAGETFALLDVPSMKVLWKDVQQPGGMPYGNDGQLYVVSSDPRDLRCRDCATGELRAHIRLPTAFDKWFAPWMLTTPDRQSLLVTQPYCANPANLQRGWRRWVQWLPGLKQEDSNPGAAVVLDIPTSRERLCVTHWSLSKALLSDGGQTLVTVHYESNDHRILRCWNVDAFKPLRWPIGIPATLATLAVLFAVWRRRRAAAPRV